MRNKINFMALLLAVLGFVNFNTYAQQLQQDPNLVKGKLKNGFTYYIYKSSKTNGNSVLRLFLNAGSLQEEPPARLGPFH